MRRWVKALLFTGLGILAAGLIALFIAYAINGFSFRRAILPGHHSGNVALKNVEENIHLITNKKPEIKNRKRLFTAFPGK